MNVFSEIVKLLHQYGAKGKITRETKFSDVDIDSLDLMEIIVDAEKKYNFSIPDEKLYDIKTVGDLIIIINALLSGEIKEESKKPEKKSRKFFGKKTK